MALVKCRNCSGQLSSGAKNCPKCGQPRKPVKLEPCRACSAPLDPRVYAATHTGTAIQNGTSTTTTFTHHVPCPKCGEPKPLALTIREKTTMFVAGPLALLWLFWEMRAPHGFGTFVLPTGNDALMFFGVENFFLYWAALFVSLLVFWFFESVLGLKLY